VLCDSFHIPLIRMMDTPGFVVGLDAERRGAPGHIMNFMNATCLTTTPQITVIVRKAYGRAYVAMGGGAHNDAMVAWPTAEVSFMDPVFATSIVHDKTAGDDGFEDALAHIQKDLEIWDMARIFRARRRQAAGDPGFPHPHARPAAPPAHRRDRRASHADLADELLSGRRWPQREVRPAASSRSLPRSSMKRVVARPDAKTESSRQATRNSRLVLMPSTRVAFRASAALAIAAARSAPHAMIFAMSGS
jgi:hypothetical protein